MATATTDIVIGPWGGEGGDTPWIFKPEGRIVDISIRSEEAVDSISFNYTDKEGLEDDSEIYGGDGGLLHAPCPRVKTSLGLVELSEKFQTTQ
ncbi:unnamed protein product [Lactuca saligna]|uniref:Jacalin-type lectin domain-containing protein n=1 Tax=Lactuca saligna TaxID=75948 RepID=A0AA35UR51_LACSI|nr:unnamed protein product [Lactuca saligna]